MTWDADDIRAWRARMKMTQEQAADALGVSWETYRSYEPGSSGKPRRDVPKYIARLAALIELQGVVAIEIGDAADSISAAYIEARRMRGKRSAERAAIDGIEADMRVALDALAGMGMVLCRKRSA